MARAILIAEKPSLMRTIKAVYEKHKDELPDQIDFLAQAGHIVELYSPIDYDDAYKNWDIDLLPINPAKEGGWKYKISEGKENIYNNIKNAVTSGTYDYVIHAGDPDQEGELLIRLPLEMMHNSLPVMRFWTNAQDETSVFNALANLEDDNSEFYNNLYSAALIRQHSDWLFGMNGSRAIANKIYGFVIAVGRVMTWVLTQVVNREDEINSFVPTTEYSVKSSFSKDYIDFSADLINEDGERIFFPNRADAENVLKSLSSTAKVIDYTTKRDSSQPPKLFKLATLQQAASKKGYTAAQTLQIAQSLYEKKLLTYPRTDCEYLGSRDNFTAMLNSASAISSCQPFIDKAKNRIQDYKTNSRFVNDKKLANSGHSALAPTIIKPDLTSLSEDEKTIYELVAKQFVASMLEPLVADSTVAILENNGVKFKATGKTLISAGYNELLKKKFNDSEMSALTIGTELTTISNDISDKTSKCPSRYTDGSMVMAMENPSKFFTDEEMAKKTKGMTIGTPATRDSIIQKLIRDKYITRNKTGQLCPTESGSYLIHNISHLDLCKTEMTGAWDQKLTEIREGYAQADEVEIYMLGEVNKLISEVKEMETKRNATVLGKCPKCGSDVVPGKYGAYCTGKCGMMNLGQIYSTKLTDKQVSALLAGEKIIVRGLTSKSGKKYDMSYTPDGIEEYTYTNKANESVVAYRYKFKTDFVNNKKKKY